MIELYSIVIFYSDTEVKHPIPWGGELSEQGRSLSDIACFHIRLRRLVFNRHPRNSSNHA